MRIATRAAAVLVLLTASPAVYSTDFEDRRSAMVAEIDQDVRETAQYTGLTEFDARVMESLGTTPRHEFVPGNLQKYAYENRPLPIGHGQTISQPYIVALMTHLLEPGPDHVLLEVGTGSGYQAAILSGLVKQVYTMEIIAPLADQAEQRLHRLEFKNVTTRLGDGYFGWEEKGPFDAIIVTAAASHVPPPLIQQLKPGGRMVVPVGDQFSVQQLLLIEKTPDQRVITRQILPVRFVPLTGDH